MDIQHDVIVVGGGVAGLYTAMRVLETRPTANVVVLEKSHRLGGRIGNARFRGANVVCGAGVGRLEKDALLLSLLKKLKLPAQLLPRVSHHFANTVKKVDIVATIKKLQRIEREIGPSKRSTFKSFAKAQLGSKEYNEFVQTTGYSDFEKEDAHDVLYNYGMDDNADGWTPVRVIWDDLVDALKTWLMSHPNIRIKKNVCVTRWDYHQSNRSITIFGKAKNGRDIIYKGNAMVVATTIDTLRTIFPTKSIYAHIHGQPFMRLYAQVARPSRAAMASAVPSITIVPPPLQEIIPFNHDEGIYMIGYADNESARQLQKYQSNKRVISSIAEKALALPKGSIQISYTQAHFWEIGTHYYDVLPRRFQTRNEFIHEAQRPHPNVFVVGEVVAINQGWVEGALQSVENVLNEINVLKK